MAQTVKCARTLIKFATQNTTYTEGVGSKTNWKTIQVSVGKDGNGIDIMTDCFYCEWLNSYGSTAIQQQADGAICPARIRMPFVKAVYDALINDNVKIYKNGIIDDAHCFTLNSAADNYNESDKLLEFQVKKYVVK